VWAADTGRPAGQARSPAAGHRPGPQCPGHRRHPHRRRIIGGGLSEEDGAAAARRLLDEEDRPTAITVFNDRSATGVLDVLARAGLRVPEDISVVGYDDSHLARLAHINLTTIAQDTAEMTRLSVDRAIARIDGSELTNRALIVAPQLIVRGTTAPPAA
jgi:DNA-binding LacI/PurR family transcriptional regulator